MNKVFTAVYLLAQLVLVSPVLATDAAVAYAHYANGNYADAYREYRGLAEVGYAPYQAQIASMLANGQGVEKNLLQAYAWYALAASQGDPVGQKNIALLAQELSRDELQQSIALAEQYGQRYVAPFRPHWQLRSQ